jgi:acetoin utilization deacetylase AcuC-like enzyme
MTDKITSIGILVSQAASACGGGYFAILEGGYNHEVLGHNVGALIEGFTS